MLLNRPGGKTFSVSAPELEVKKGDSVTFSFDNYSSAGIPTNASITRIRTDVHSTSEQQHQFFTGTILFSLLYCILILLQVLHPDHTDTGLQIMAKICGNFLLILPITSISIP